MLKRFAARIGRFFNTRQSNSGADALQIGEVHGNLTIVHVTEKGSTGPSAQFTPAEEARLRAEQARVLRLLSAVPNRGRMIEFMRREFGTSMVKELTFPQLFRARRYMEAALRREGVSNKSPRSDKAHLVDREAVKFAPTTPGEMR